MMGRRASPLQHVMNDRDAVIAHPVRLLNDARLDLAAGKRLLRLLDIIEAEDEHIVPAGALGGLQDARPSSALIPTIIAMSGCKYSISDAFCAASIREIFETRTSTICSERCRLMTERNPSSRSV